MPSGRIRPGMSAMRRTSDWVHGMTRRVLHFAAVVPLARVEADPLTAFEVNVAWDWQLLEERRARQIWTVIGIRSPVMPKR